VGLITFTGTSTMSLPEQPRRLCLERSPSVANSVHTLFTPSCFRVSSTRLLPIGFGTLAAFSMVEFSILPEAGLSTWWAELRERLVPTSSDLVRENSLPIPKLARSLQSPFQGTTWFSLPWVLWCFGLDFLPLTADHPMPLLARMRILLLGELSSLPRWEERPEHSLL
jgi:hypothetical protein